MLSGQPFWQKYSAFKLFSTDQDHMIQHWQVYWSYKVLHWYLSLNILKYCSIWWLQIGRYKVVLGGLLYNVFWESHFPQYVEQQCVWESHFPQYVEQQCVWESHFPQYIERLRMTDIIESLWSHDQTLFFLKINYCSIHFILKYK